MLATILTSVLIIFLAIVGLYILIGIPLSFVKSIFENSKTEEEAKKTGASFGIATRHLRGLELDKMERCRIFVFDDSLKICANKRDLSFALQFNRIKAVNTKRKMGSVVLVVTFENKDGIIKELEFLDNMNNRRTKQFANQLKNYLGTNHEKTAIEL